jgi:hypothetical protein
MLHINVLDQIPDLTALAAACGVAPSTVYGWRRAKHVPSAYWTQVARHANALGITVTALDLMAGDLLAHRLKPPRKPRAAQQPSKG